MKKTLRKKFIVFAMSAVTILLVVLVGAISGLSWIILDSQSSAILHTLANGDKNFPPMKPPGLKPFAGGVGDYPPVETSRPLPFAPPMDMDIIQSARFFMVRTARDGTVLDVNIDHISSVSAEQAAQYAGQITGASGKIEGYKYEVKQFGADRLIFFMDISGQFRMCVMALSISSAIALICWLVILLFVIPLSGRVVRPILAGMEKQKQFITNAGHELQTPLAIIQSNNDAATLIYGESKYSRNIRLQTQRLNVLMTNLLTLAKLDEETKLPTKRVDISELIFGILTAWEDAAAEKQISLSVNV